MTTTEKKTPLRAHNMQPAEDITSRLERLERIVRLQQVFMDRLTTIAAAHQQTFNAIAEMQAQAQKAGTN